MVIMITNKDEVSISAMKKTINFKNAVFWNVVQRDLKDLLKVVIEYWQWLFSKTLEIERE